MNVDGSVAYWMTAVLMDSLSNTFTCINAHSGFRVQVPTRSPTESHGISEVGTATRTAGDTTQ